MPDISISADQRERLQWVQSRLADDVTYGHVRPCDALEYLLDRFDETGGEVDTTATVESTDQSVTTTEPLGNGASTRVVDPGAHSGTGKGSAAAGDDADDGSDGDDGDDTGDERRTSDPETTLNSMMSLLEDNAEVWRESSAGEEKYEVDLPDGSTERARTKDDVRALLFKHYR